MRCCVPFCTNRTRKSTGSPVRYHRFPAAADTCRLWLLVMNHRLAREPPGDVRSSVKNLRVCGDHFSPDDYKEGLQRDILKHAAVPSRLLRSAQVKREEFPVAEQLKSDYQQELQQEDEELPERPLTPSEERNSSMSESSCVALSKEVLLMLLFRCLECSGECRVWGKGKGGNLSLQQECLICCNYRVWTSQLADTPNDKIAQVSVVLSSDDVCLQTSGDASINQEESNDEEVLNLYTEEEDEEYNCSQPTSQDSLEVQEENETSVVLLEDEENVEDVDEALSDSEDNAEVDPADSEYLPSSSGKSSENSEEDELDDSSTSEKPFQSTFKSHHWCLDCEAHAGISCMIKKHRRVYGCPQCVSEDTEEIQCLEDLPVRFDSRFSFHKHAITVHGAPEQPPEFKSCEDCNKLNRVEDEHHVCECKLKPFSCELCSKRFLTENGRKVHYRRLHGDYTHFCKYCMINFSTKQSKLQHEQVHNTRGLPYSCPSCSMRFKDFHERNNHLKSHDGLKGYICSMCGLRFSKAARYERHLLIHSGEKPYRCEVCERSFNQAGHLKSHMRLHTGEKPFMCEQCGECFNHNVSLKNHLLRQHGIDTKYLPTKEGKRVGRPFSDVPLKRRFKEYNRSTQHCSYASSEGGDVMHDPVSYCPEESNE